MTRNDEKFVTDWASLIKPEEADVDGEWSDTALTAAKAEEYEFARRGELEEAKFEDKYEDRLREAQIRSLEQDIDERKSYANKIFGLICGWLGAVILLVVYSGWSGFNVSISDPVLIALISGISVNVIALFAIVANYLFPKR